jgi:hypothetical protein
VTLLLIALAALILACFTVGAVKRFTFAKTLRVMVWAWSHPWRALSGRYPHDKD